MVMKKTTLKCNNSPKTTLSSRNTSKKVFFIFRSYMYLESTPKLFAKRSAKKTALNCSKSLKTTSNSDNSFENRLLFIFRSYMYLEPTTKLFVYIYFETCKFFLKKV